MKRSLAQLILSFAFTAGFPGQALCDTAGPPLEEIIKSPNGQYYLHSVPMGEWLEEGYYIEWTFGKTDGPVYFTKKAFYASDIQIADDGEHFVAAGNYVHNMLREDSAEHEGLWFYDRQGNLIRHVNRPRCYFPERSASSLWWLENGIISGNTYLLTLKDGSTRRYDLTTGGLTWYTPSLGFIAYYGTIVAYIIYLTSLLRKITRYLRSYRERLSLTFLWRMLAEKKSAALKTILSAGVCSSIVFVTHLIIVFINVYYNNDATVYVALRFAFWATMPLTKIVIITSILFFSINREAVFIRSVVLTAVLVLLDFVVFRYITSLTLYYLLPFTASLVLLIPPRALQRIGLYRLSKAATEME